ncbi:MAG TPA: Type 1 glutamine amidotransferase-like domain-containing protein [Candidatus Saccharimonadales bacterium]|nr:Type 1 glutamine amidotransferase-like domain-containing protein [Candidatus Saccharimonadales bacterium]
MRLFLSSQDLGNYGKVAAKLAGNNKRAAFIKNAQDFKSLQERNFSTPDKKTMFLEAGFDYFEEIDLRSYFGESAKLLNKLSNFGSIWCAGGNTFILRRAMKASGLDEILKQLLADDKALYGGWSAGAMIMSPSLQGADWGEEDRPDLIPEGYDQHQRSIWEGLNQVSFYIVPHVGNPEFGNGPQKTIDYFESHNLPYKILRDGQVIVVDGEKVEFLK